MHPRLSVVIVNYNTCALLRACLQSLVAQDYRCEIIVVDNASHDDSVAMVRAEFPQVRLLAQERNTWFCGGNNIGIRASDGEYVLLLNPDTVVSANALLRMVTFLRDNAHYAGVTAQMRYPNAAHLFAFAHLSLFVASAHVFGLAVAHPKRARLSASLVCRMGAR
jgi:N-acetylglucosaminyl-diphospho-decaprenol L-rhamnosyltransferase